MEDNRGEEDEGKKGETKIKKNIADLRTYVEFARGVSDESSHRKRQQQSRENLPIQVPSFVRRARESSATFAIFPQ